MPFSKATFSISPSTGTLVECSSTTLLWTEQPPIHLWAAPNRDVSPGDPTLRDFGVVNDTFLLWRVDLPAGQNVSFTYVQTSNPTLLFSSDQAYPVISGTNASCLNSASSAPASSDSSSTSSGSSPASSGSSSTSSTAPNPTSSIDLNSASTHHKSVRRAAILGGVVGLCVVLIGVLVFFWVRHRRSRTSDRLSIAYESARYLNRPDVQDGNTSGRVSPFTMPAALLSTASTIPPSQSLEPGAPFLMRAVDGGVTLGNAQQEEVLPPAYHDYSAGGSSSVPEGAHGDSLGRLEPATRPPVSGRLKR